MGDLGIKGDSTGLALRTSEEESLIYTSTTGGNNEVNKCNISETL